MKSNQFLSKKLTFFILCFFISNFSWGQVSFKLNIPHFVFGSTTTKSIRTAAEIQLSDRYSTQIEYGLSWQQIFPNLNSRISNMSSNIWHLEIRRYFISGFEQQKGQYLALDYFHKDQRYNRLWNVAQSISSSQTSNSQRLNVTRNEKAISLIFGYQSNQEPKQNTRMFFDIYLGLGARSRKVTTDLLPDRKIINHNLGDLLDKDQNRLMLNAIFGIKVGLKLFDFKRR